MLHFFHINFLGLAILGIGFGAAFAVGHVAGFNDEERLMIVAGFLIAILDFVFRLTSEDGHWLHPRRGGMLFFLPVWVFGVLWVGIGAYHVARELLA